MKGNSSDIIGDKFNKILSKKGLIKCKECFDQSFNDIFKIINILSSLIKYIV